MNRLKRPIEYLRPFGQLEGTQPWCEARSAYRRRQERRLMVRDVALGAVLGVEISVLVWIGLRALAIFL
jgi:hypothetical protein